MLSVRVGVAKQPEEAEVATVAPSVPLAVPEAAGVEPSGDPPSSGVSLEELHLTLRLKKLEIQARHLRIRQLELEQRGLPAASTPISPHSGPRFAAPAAFDISRHIKCVLPFCEAEVDSYICVFERVQAYLLRTASIMKLLRKQYCKPMSWFRRRIGKSSGGV